MPRSERLRDAGVMPQSRHEIFRPLTLSPPRRCPMIPNSRPDRGWRSARQRGATPRLIRRFFALCHMDDGFRASNLLFSLNRSACRTGLGAELGAKIMRLSASDLACLRGNREVFANLNFEVVAGEVLSVTGPNGAGKSSLLRL